MALGATVYKAQLSISDLDRNWYGEPVLTLARHPSETETRLMLRVLAWCMRAGENWNLAVGSLLTEIQLFGSLTILEPSLIGWSWVSQICER